MQPRCLQAILYAAVFPGVLIFAENWQEIVAAALFVSAPEDPSIVAVRQSLMPAILSGTLH